MAVSETHSAPAGFLRDSESKVHVWVRTVAGRDSHSILLQICGQEITATDMGQICDSEFLAIDLRAELALCQQWRSGEPRGRGRLEELL